MESQFANKKTELKERIRSLEAERNSLENDISYLRERVEVMELERYSSSLDNEVGTLKIEKTLLEEKIATIGSQGEQQAQSEVAVPPTASAVVSDQSTTTSVDNAAAS